MDADWASAKDGPSIRQLRCFLRAAELGSIGRAAEEIGISQPAASHAIARLEAILGVPLLARHAGGTAFSRAGEVLALRARRFLNRLEQGFLEAELPPAGQRRALNFLRMVHVRAHIAVAETGSFAGAAERLDISGPALHRAAREFEHVLQKAIYRPGVNGIGVNGLGESLARQMRLAMHELSRAWDELRGDGGTPSPLVIGILPLMPKQWIANAIARMREAHPEARIDLHEASYSILLRDLRWAALDLILGALPPEESETDVVHEPLIADPYVLVVRKSHPLSRVRVPSLGMLAKHDWVVPSHNLPRRAVLERFFATLPVRPRIWLDTNSSGTMMAALAKTDCISIASSTQLMIDGPSDLAVLPVAMPDSGRMIGITRRADWLPLPAETAFLEALRRTAPVP